MDGRPGKPSCLPGPNISFHVPVFNPPGRRSARTRPPIPRGWSPGLLVQASLPETPAAKFAAEFPEPSGRDAASSPFFIHLVSEPQHLTPCCTGSFPAVGLPSEGLTLGSPGRPGFLPSPVPCPRVLLPGQFLCPCLKAPPFRRGASLLVPRPPKPRDLAKPDRVPAEPLPDTAKKNTEWVVYAKPPFGGTPKGGSNNLAPPGHKPTRVAISNYTG